MSNPSGDDPQPQTAGAGAFPPAMPAGHDPYSSLRYPAYRLFTVGWMAAVIGQMMTATAIGWEVYGWTHSELSLGYVAGIQVIPLVFLALPGGILADRFDRRKILSLGCLGAAICSLTLALISYHRAHVGWVYLVMLALSCCLTLGRPSRSAILPHLVPTDVFPNAVTWNASFFQLSAMLGPAIGGLVLAWNVQAVYIIDACCSIAYAAIALSLPENEIPVHHGEAALSMLAKGLKFVWSTKIVLATLSLDLFAVLLGGVVYLLPVFSKDILHVGATGYGWLRAAESSGAFVMAIIMAHLPPMKRAGRSMLLAVAGFGLCTIVFGISRNFALSFAMLFIIGAVDNISVVVRHTLVQMLTPDAMRGRVSSVNNIFIGASNELGGLESGVTAHWFGPVGSAVFGGIGSIVTVIATAAIWPQLLKFGSLIDARPEEARRFEPTEVRQTND
ncbi:MAG: MFS transporter [Tepidisphaeraceae bacterium]|jgi:MFS family permease